MCVTLIMELGGAWRGGRKKSVHLQQFSGEELLFSKFFFFFSAYESFCFLLSSF